MIDKTKTLLEIVEDHPERETTIRAFDEKAGACLLCSNLFDSLEAIEDQYGIDLSEMVDKLNTL